MSLERTPSTVGVGLTAVAGLIAVVATLLAGWGIGMIGAGLAIVGVVRCSRRLLGLGVGVLLLASVAAGATGVPTPLVLLAIGATVLTWDVGENAISLGEQLRARARTGRVALVHAAASTLVVTVVAVGSYLLFRFVTTGRSGIALAILVVGTLLAVVALKR